MEQPESAAHVPVSQLAVPDDDVSKSITIRIDPQDLQRMQAGDYSLCFAMNFAGDITNYTVVGQALSSYLEITTFSWIPEFALYVARGFQEGAEVTPITNMQPIGLGETCTLDYEGVMGEPSTGWPDNGLTVVNQFGPINPGVSQALTLNGQTAIVPVYVSFSEVALGTTTVLPVNKVQVWFAQGMRAGTMFSTAQQWSVEADLTVARSVTLSFANEQWTISWP